MTDQIDVLIKAGVHPLTAQAINEIVSRHTLTSLSDAALLAGQLWPPDQPKEAIVSARADWFGNPAIDDRYKRILDATADALPESVQVEFVPAHYVSTFFDTAKAAEWPSAAVRAAVERLWQKATDQLADQPMFGDRELPTTLHSYSLADLAGLYVNYERAGMPKSHPFRLLLGHYFDYALVEPVNPQTFTGLQDDAAVKGGLGSGNFGHAGRPGERGGSAPKGSTATNLQTALRNAESAIRGRSDEHLYLFDRDGNEIFSTVGNAESVGIASGVETTGATMTHNHPVDPTRLDYAPSLSTGDIRSALDHRLAQVRAVGDRFDYVMDFSPDIFLDRDLENSIREQAGILRTEVVDELMQEVDAGRMTKQQVRTESPHYANERLAAKFPQIQYKRFSVGQPVKGGVGSGNHGHAGRRRSFRLGVF